MAKKAPMVPAGISAIAVAAAPSLFKKALTSDHKPSAKVLFSPVSLNNIYLNVGHTGLEKARLLGNLKKNPNWKTAIYIHDVLPVTHPHLFVDGTKQKHEVRMRNVVKFSDIVFANSHFTADETERLYKRKVDAVLEIGSEASTTVPSHSGERTGFVSIGTVEPRKNYLWLVTSWISFCKNYPDLVKGEKLTIFGASGWLNGSNLEKLKEEIDSSLNVEMVHGASDEDVTTALMRSRAYLTAAEVEGWGMPLAESLTLGTPVICSDVKAHREVTRGKANFFEFNNEAELHAMLLKSYTDSAEEMEETASQFEPWLWVSHFARLNSVVQSF
ncbi:glycosyltransferase [Agrobacterium sp. OT33]|uniref:glycosyltransferase n=1 Tax=Agrobacterium sp. OT33 TaxID=2815338 RepID=UPI001A8D88F8|nr:glycosyltransferase [Agrobacterium sp. OT33]MBO0125232.1 glycosyltransferase [Agrobacterium sp. OT33]